ncbi:hypothetical protein P7H62_08225 [Vagococcus carniphilus]|uniref:DUF3784 domain-containing protein n=1 Tax=Vagococcus carniphilus TaxID=218144 RepID=A0AAW8U334_9ENTE|nr:hypothetical protein [Vagococcus carniphilus]MDT2830003.1 hypothetical protein [Vagococcus carniphilus]MDT2833938.1 hypothetical protein [Vagococcus carniphilus]MDT2838438.1 hypothetical protein [Vagococcus carniphilus]MDT2854434.1 hypothetical protein [Vagococcus carniphilus]
MIKIVMLLFSLVLLIIGWYLRKNVNKLELVFTKENNRNLLAFSSSFLGLGIIGIPVSFIFSTKEFALFFVAIVLVVSATFSIRLSKKMK